MNRAIRALEIFMAALAGVLIGASVVSLGAPPAGPIAVWLIVIGGLVLAALLVGGVDNARR